MEQKNVKENRKSNFELLRVISMIIIICFHFCCRNSSVWNVPYTNNSIWVVLLGSWGPMGNCLFIMITGYFLIESKRFKLSKVLKILFQVHFYTIGILIIVYLMNLKNITFIDVVKTFFPIILDQYWFITAYIFLYFFAQFINHMVENMTNERLKLLVKLLAIFIIAYRIIYGKSPINNIMLVLAWYIIIIYLKRNPGNWFERNSKKGFIISYFLMSFLNVIVLYIGTKFDIEFIIRNATRFTTSDLSTIPAIFLFYWFKNLKIEKSTVINKIASTVFAVYIIHENFLINTYISNNIFKIGEAYLYSNYFPFVLIGTVVITFIICSLVEYVRIKILGKFEDKIIQKLGKLIEKFDNIMNVK